MSLASATEAIRAKVGADSGLNATLKFEVELLGLAEGLRQALEHR
eukprot:gene30548-52701_t